MTEVGAVETSEVGMAETARTGAGVMNVVVAEPKGGRRASSSGLMSPIPPVSPEAVQSTYSRPVRLLHALLALSITIQLVSSLVMGHPNPSRPMTPNGAFYFHWHEWLGLAALAVLIVGWIYRVTRWRRESQARLFPWVTRQGLRDLAREMKSFLTLRWNRIPDYGALAGTVHGAGLLLATAMALTGGAIYLALGPHDAITAQAEAIMNVHQSMAVFMWMYLCGHSLMALWRQYAAWAKFGRIFAIGR
ncbi:MAG TPA: cytochrome b/b6 domain-containing protein [Burkholderiales bacterium]|jgi:Ni,Fe-hydrogenase I cytochrome b subunit|nr:cytochrome b/b6 domain-containing protein [Burkholderiales bacterium]